MTMYRLKRGIAAFLIIVCCLAVLPVPISSSDAVRSASTPDDAATWLFGAQVHETKAGTVRLIGVFDDYRDPRYDAVGFHIYANGVENKTPIRIGTVYESLCQKGDAPIHPAKEGETFFTFCIDGITEAAVGASTVVFTVSTYVIIDGAEQESKPYELTYDLLKNTLCFASAAQKSALQNTYFSLTAQKKLNVAYLGGSVTVGAFADAGGSFREQTTAWLASHFDATVTETNAGIGGTGSLWGAYRAIEHLKLESPTQRPDLVFLDFAVNDYYDGTLAQEVTLYAETLIREIYRFNPYAEIIVLIVGEQWTVNSDQANAWRAVAAHYELPVVELVQRLLTDIEAQNKTWQDYVADAVHPNNEGHAMYASYIAQLLQEELIDKKPELLVKKEKQLPSTALAPSTLQDLAYYETYRLPLRAGCGFAPCNVTNETERGIAASSVGASLRLAFFGTGLKLSLGSPCSLTLEYSIDGAPYRELALTDRVTLALAEGLETGTHTVHIRIKAIASGSCHIRRLLVEGDTQRTGIVVHSSLSVQDSNAALSEDGWSFDEMFSTGS